jgi:hypothetical protein
MKIGFNCSSCDLFHAGHVTMEKIEEQVEQYSPELLEKYSLKDNDQGKM